MTLFDEWNRGLEPSSSHHQRCLQRPCATEHLHRHVKICLSIPNSPAVPAIYQSTSPDDKEINAFRLRQRRKRRRVDTSTAVTSSESGTSHRPRLRHRKQAQMTKNVTVVNQLACALNVESQR